MGTLRCPTCLSVLLDGGESRCPFCRARLKTRKPVVLREDARIAARPVLAVERERKAKVDAEITAAERERYAPATMARLETPHAPRRLEADSPYQPARVKRRERRQDSKPPRHGEVGPSHSLLEVLADYVIEGAPTRTVEPVVVPEPVAVEEVATEPVDAVEAEPVDEVAAPAEAVVAATAFAEPAVDTPAVETPPAEKKVTGKTRSRLLRRRPMTPERRMDDALASLRVEVKVDALKRALEEPAEPIADVVCEPEPEVEVEPEAEVAEATAVEVAPEPIADEEPAAETPIAPVDDIWPQYDDEPERQQVGARRGWRIPWIARREPDTTDAEVVAGDDETDAAVAALVEPEELVAPVEADTLIEDDVSIATDDVTPVLDGDRDELAARVESSIDALLAFMPAVVDEPVAETAGEPPVDEHLDETATANDVESIVSDVYEPLATAEEPIARVDAAVQALMALLPGTVEVAPIDNTPSVADEPVEPLALESTETDEPVDAPAARVEASVDALMALLEAPAPPTEDAAVETPPEGAPAPAPRRRRSRLTRRAAEVAEPVAVAAEPEVEQVAEPEVVPEPVALVEEAPVEKVVFEELVVEELVVEEAPVEEVVAEVAADRKARRRRRSRLISRPADVVDATAIAAEPEVEPAADLEPVPEPVVLVTEAEVEHAIVEDAAVEEAPVAEEGVDEEVVDEVGAEAVSITTAPKRRRRWATRRAPAAEEPRTTLFDVEPVDDRADVVEPESAPAAPAFVAQTLDLTFEPVADADAPPVAKRRKRRVPKRSRRDDDEVPATLFESAWPPVAKPIEPVADLVAETEPEPAPAEPVIDLVAAEAAEAEVVEPEVVEPEVVEPDIDLAAEPADGRSGTGSGARGWRVRRGTKGDPRPETPAVVSREVVVPEIVDEPAAASVSDRPGDAVYYPHDGNGGAADVVAGDRRSDGRVEFVDRRKAARPSVDLPAQTRAVRIKTIKENGRRRWVVDVLVRQDEANNKRK